LKARPAGYVLRILTRIEQDEAIVDGPGDCGIGLESRREFGIDALRSRRAIERSVAALAQLPRTVERRLAQRHPAIAHSEIECRRRRPLRMDCGGQADHEREGRAEGDAAHRGPPIVNFRVGRDNPVGFPK